MFASPATRSRLRITLCLGLLVAACATAARGEDPQSAESPVTGPTKEGPRRLDPDQYRIGRLIPDLEFTDIAGERHRLSDFTEKHTATVIALTETGCPLSKKFLPRLQRLADRYGERDTAFVFVNMSTADEPADLREYVDEREIDVPYVHDPDKRFGRTFRAETTTDVFVLDAGRTLVYRGPVDDQYGIGYIRPEPRRHYLQQALEAVLAGRPPQVAALWSPGCELALDHEDEPGETSDDLTYHGRIARLVNRHCVECHREGGIAPFSLATCDDVVGHRGMIRKVVSRGLMPPWFASHESGPWANDRTMPAADKRDLLAWLDGDRARGDKSEAPVPPRFPDGWTIGRPDRVVRLPEPIAVPAEGLIPYKYARARLRLEEDKWVKAMEIRPTQREVVHHVLVFARKPDSKKRDGVDGFLAAYVPGNSHRVYREGLARKLPAGTDLIFQMHYTPNGRAVEDRTELGLIFADEPPRHAVRVRGIANTKIRIPPHAANHRETASLRVPRRAKLLALMPHMHYRGRAFRYELLPKEGERTRLLDVPQYDFNWQLSYRFAEPVTAHRGDRIEVTAWYDNSPDNPANPNPDKTVEWGLQSVDEMLIGYVEYYFPGDRVASADD